MMSLVYRCVTVYRTRPFEGPGRLEQREMGGANKEQNFHKDKPLRQTDVICLKQQLDSTQHVYSNNQ